MAWGDVPGKLDEYDNATYAPNRNAMTASESLLAMFDAVTVADVPEHRREEFEAALDYRLGACKNLEASRAIHPSKLRG